MFPRYEHQNVTADAFRELLAEAEAAEDDFEWELPELCVLVVKDASEERDVDDEVLSLLEGLEERNRDEIRCSFSAIDLFDAADAKGLLLGTVYSTSSRSDKVVRVDYEACVDALACAAVSSLPAWLVSRYDRVVRDRPTGGTPREAADSASR